MVSLNPTTVQNSGYMSQNCAILHLCFSLDFGRVCFSLDDSYVGAHCSAERLQWCVVLAICEETLQQSSGRAAVNVKEHSRYRTRTQEATPFHCAHVCIEHVTHTHAVYQEIHNPFLHQLKSSQSKHSPKFSETLELLLPLSSVVMFQ